MSMHRCFARARTRALRPALLSIALCLFGWIHAGSAMADTMRCGTKLVATGDSPYDVRSRCGEPAFATRRVEYRSVSAFGAGVGATRTVEVVIDEWTYDFGPQHFVQHLIFEQGRLVSVVSGHRGHKKKPE
jgi:hypothetical protein